MVLDYHCPQRRCLDEGGVSAENQHQIRRAANCLGAEHGMAGAQLLFLDHRNDVLIAKGQEHFFALVADDNRSSINPGGIDSGKDVVQHGVEEDLVQHLARADFMRGCPCPRQG